MSHNSSEMALCVIAPTERSSTVVISGTANIKGGNWDLSLPSKRKSKPSGSTTAGYFNKKQAALEMISRHGNGVISGSEPAV